MRFAFDIASKPNLRARFRHLGAAGVDEVLAQAALEVERRAKLKAPVDHGRLRASISAFKTAPLEHGVKVGVEYGAFVEFGTGQRGAASAQPGGIADDYAHGPSKGMRAQPYLRPALLEVRRELQSPKYWRGARRG